MICKTHCVYNILLYCFYVIHANDDSITSLSYCPPTWIVIQLLQPPHHDMKPSSKSKVNIKEGDILTDLNQVYLRYCEIYKAPVDPDISIVLSLGLPILRFSDHFDRLSLMPLKYVVFQLLSTKELYL